MKKLLKFEFYKLFKQKSFYICTAIILGLAALNLVAIKYLLSEIESEPNLIFSSPIRSVMSTVSGNFTMLSGIFVALFVCGDFSQQTIKNIYSRGFSKTEVFFSKYIVAVVGTLIMLALNYAVSFIFAAIFLGEISITGTELYQIAAQIITILAFTSFAFTLSMIFRKTGASIALTIVGPTIIDLLLLILSTIIGSQGLLTKYFISGILSILSSSTLDATSLMNTITEGALTNADITQFLLISLAYAVVFVVIGFFVNKKRDT